MSIEKLILIISIYLLGLILLKTRIIKKMSTQQKIYSVKLANIYIPSVKYQS